MACDEAGTELRFGFCEWCWERLPEDVQERIHWAYEYGRGIDRKAARRAALEHLTAVSGDL